MALKSGIFAGIIAFIIAFIAEFPIYPPENWVINFKLFSLHKTNFYYWGYTTNGHGVFTPLLGSIPECLISVCFWSFIFIIGLNSIMASTSKANLNNSLKLFKLNILLLILILIIFSWIAVTLILEDFSSFFDIIGLGYYLTISVLILNIIAVKKVKKL